MQKGIKLRARLGTHKVKGKLGATGAISNKCALSTIDYANLTITIKSNDHARTILRLTGDLFKLYLITRGNT